MLAPRSAGLSGGKGKRGNSIHNPAYATLHSCHGGKGKRGNSIHNLARYTINSAAGGKGKRGNSIHNPSFALNAN